MIPDTLTELEQWICWREDERDGKPTKVPIKPYNTNGSSHASATDPSHWRDFETADAYHRTSSTRTDGIGFVFAPETKIVGIDLDHCRDPDTGEIEDWARQIVQRLDSYTEVSPSGTGLHVLVEGELQPGRNRRGDIEMYDEARFFTVTGDHVDMTPDHVGYRQDAIDGVHYDFVQTAPGDTDVQNLSDIAESTGDTSDATADSPGQNRDQDDVDARSRASDQDIGPNSGLRRKFGRNYPDIEDPALEAALHNLAPNQIPTPVPQMIEDIAGPGVEVGDEDLLDRAFNSKSGEKIEALYAGDSTLWNGHDSVYPSQSEADMALLFYLAFWTGGDPDRMDRLFRKSALHREKWDRQHYATGATYGDVCIARTLLQVTDYYEPGGQQTAADRTWGSGADSSGVTSGETNAGTTASYSSRKSSRNGQRGSTGRNVSNDDQPPRIDMGAVQDAQRLANQVKHQQRQLEAQRERLRDLERRLKWYREYLGIQPDTTPVTNRYDDVRDIDPIGDPAPVPQDSREGEEEAADDVVSAEFGGGQSGELVDSDIDEVGRDDRGGSDWTQTEKQHSRAVGIHELDGEDGDDTDDDERRGFGSLLRRWFS